MSELFNGNFTLKIDTSRCTSCITGKDVKMGDTWYYSDQVFESGKIYGLVSEYGCGCSYLAHLAGGREDLENVRIYCGERQVSREELEAVSFCLEPCNEPYGNKKVLKCIEKALAEHPEKGDLRSIAEKFLLDPENTDRKFRELRNDRWGAAAALGYIQRKKIFFAPYKTSVFYRQMCQTGLLKCFRELTDAGAIVLLPVGSDEFIRHIADEVIHLGQKYDLDELRRFYLEKFGMDAIH